MKQKLVMGFVFVLALASFASAHVGEDDYAHHAMMSSVYGFDFMWIFGGIFMILLIVALMLLIVWLIKQIQKPEKRK